MQTKQRESEYKKNRSKKFVEEGRCAKCGKSNDGNFLTCLLCREKSRSYNKTSRGKEGQKRWKHEHRERVNGAARKRYALGGGREYHKQWEHDHREERNARARKVYTTDKRWEKQLKDRFDLTPEKYWEMYDQQGGVCKICKQPQTVGTKLDVDHNHVTNQVRGLLCRHCNTGMGLLRDSADLLRSALQYLLESKS